MGKYKKVIEKPLGQKFVVGSVLACRKCLNGGIVILLVCGSYLVSWGIACINFEAVQGPTVLQPFSNFDVALSNAVVTVDNLPVTVSNFSLSLGRATALTFDNAVVKINNLVPDYVPPMIFAVLNAWYLASSQFVSWVNGKLMEIPGSTQLNNVPYVTEQAINDPIFALRLELSEFSIARDFFRNITGNYTAQPWTIPAYEFSAYYYAQIGFHQISLVVLDFGIGLVTMGSLLLLVAVLQILYAFSKPFIVNTQLARGCVFETAKACCKCTKMFMLPFVHVPVIVGAVCIWIAYLLRLDADSMVTGIQGPLADADATILRDVGVVNAFIESVPNDVIDLLNTELSKTGDLTNVTQNVVNTIQGVFNSFAAQIQISLNAFLSQIMICNNCVTVPALTFAQNLFVLDHTWMPVVPYVNFTTIPTRLFSLSDTFTPPLQSTHAFIYDLANRLMIFGVITVCVPLYVVFTESCTCVCCLPRRLLEYFDLSDYEPRPKDGDDDDVDAARSTNASAAAASAAIGVDGSALELKPQSPPAYGGYGEQASPSKGVADYATSSLAVSSLASPPAPYGTSPIGSVDSTPSPPPRVPPLRMPLPRIPPPSSPSTYALLGPGSNQGSPPASP